MTVIVRQLGMSASPENPWLADPSHPQARVRLFCFPYAGGDARIYRMWSGSLPAFVDTLRVQLPGRSGRIRERPYRRLDEMVESLSHALLPLLDRPFAFFGHSMGAMISFELARYLRRNHCLEPAHLFVSGRRAPHLPSTEPPTYNLPDGEFLEEVRRLNGTPEELFEYPGLMELLCGVLRADFEVTQTYIHKEEAPLSCPITVFGGLQDHWITREQQEAWREQTLSSFSLNMLPGDHFFLRTVQPLILKILSSEIDRMSSVGPNQVGGSLDNSRKCQTKEGVVERTRFPGNPAT